MDSGIILASAISALTFYYIYQHLKVFSYWSKRGIKGPKPWPLLGTNVYFFLRNRTEVDKEWGEKYGKVYGIYEGYNPVLRISDAELIKHVYIKDFSSFTDRNHKDIHGDNLSRWFFWSKGDHWSNQRSLVTPMFTSSKMKQTFTIMAECVKNFTNEANSRLESPFIKSTSNQNQTTTNKDEVEEAKAIAKAIDKVEFSKDDFMSLALDIIAQSLFGIKLDPYKNKTSDFYRRAFAFAKFDVPHFLVWLFIPRSIATYFKIDLVTYDKYEYFDKLSQTIINERRKTDSKRNDFVDMLINAKIPEIHENVHTEEDDKEAHYNANLNHIELDKILEQQSKSVTFREFDDIEIRAHMVFFFLAGFETTSSSLSFCVYFLAHHLELQEEVYQEILAASKSSEFQLEDYTDLLKLKKLDAFISECLRIFPPVTEHNRLVTSKESVVLPTNPPVKIHPGTIISVPSIALQQDPDYFKDPLKFDMTRFYPENRDKIVPGSYMPFGLGPRNCAGMRFALLTLKKTTAEILLNYKVLPGKKLEKFPPEFNRHAFFLQLKHTDFKLVPRNPNVLMKSN